MAGRRTKRATAVTPTDRLPLPADGKVVEVAMVERDHRWLTRVEWSHGDVLCVIAPLRDDGEPYPLQPGEALTVGWSTEVGYLVALGALRGYGQDVIATWGIGVSRVEQQQRRSAFRLPLSTPVKVRGSSTEITGRTSDVSEGGLRCTQPRRNAPELGETVHVELELPGEESVIARAKVVRHREVDATNVDIGLAFVVIDAEETERIRRFIFEEQLRRRSVGT